MGKNTALPSSSKQDTSSKAATKKKQSLAPLNKPNQGLSSGPQRFLRSHAKLGLTRSDSPLLQKKAPDPVRSPSPKSSPSGILPS